MPLTEFKTEIDRLVTDLSLIYTSVKAVLIDVCVLISLMRIKPCRARSKFELNALKQSHWLSNTRLSPANEPWLKI
jgi:hypothetical protein